MSSQSPYWLLVLKSFGIQYSLHHLHEAFWWTRRARPETHSTSQVCWSRSSMPIHSWLEVSWHVICDCLEHDWGCSYCKEKVRNMDKYLRAKPTQLATHIARPCTVAPFLLTNAKPFGLARFELQAELVKQALFFPCFPVDISPHHWHDGKGRNAKWTLYTLRREFF